jgi:uncharacterized RDD family membrane protein YckC
MTEATRAGQGEPRYAGFWVRLLAACIDLILLVPLYTVCKNFEPRVPHASGAMDESIDFVTQAMPSTPDQWAFEAGFDIFSLLLYAWFLSSRLQGSPGMYLLKFHIADKAGLRISFARAFMWCATAILGWVICCAGILYMWKDILIVYEMLFSCRDQNIDVVEVCIPEIEKAIGIPFANYQQLSYAAAGMFVFMLVIWALSIALPKDKTGFHNLICGTRFLKGRP